MAFERFWDVKGTEGRGEKGAEAETILVIVKEIIKA
jgi:hypothetical protein